MTNDIATRHSTADEPVNAILRYGTRACNHRDGSSTCFVRICRGDCCCIGFNSLDLPESVAPGMLPQRCTALGVFQITFDVAVVSRSVAGSTFELRSIASMYRLGHKEWQPPLVYPLTNESSQLCVPQFPPARVPLTHGPQHGFYSGPKWFGYAPRTAAQRYQELTGKLGVSHLRRGISRGPTVRNHASLLASLSTREGPVRSALSTRLWNSSKRLGWGSRSMRSWPR